MWSQLNEGVKWVLIFLFPILAWLLAATGCAEQKATAEQALVREIGSQIIVPLAQKAMEQGTSNLQMQAGAQAIEPGYEGDFEGYWVVGLKGRFTLRLVGASGQIQISSRTEPPAATKPETDPERLP
jgi:hypothetical protein